VDSTAVVAAGDDDDFELPSNTAAALNSDSRLLRYKTALFDSGNPAVQSIS
jgi:hypothetical protein